jgi:hypothetical protein
MSEASKVVIRGFRVSDEALIYSTWRNALWYDDKEREEGSDRFYERITKEIRQILKTEGVEIRVGCTAENTDQIVGYSICFGRHLLFVYVKIDYRKCGIARLIAGDCNTVSPPRTKIGRAIVEDKQLTIKDDSWLK